MERGNDVRRAGGEDEGGREGQRGEMGGCFRVRDRKGGGRNGRIVKEERGRWDVTLQYDVEAEGPHMTSASVT